MANSWAKSHELILAISIFCGILLTVLSPFILIWISEWLKVKNTNKEPASICDKHGMYPAKHSLQLDVPVEDGPDIKQEICPFCLAERIEKANG